MDIMFCYKKRRFFFKKIFLHGLNEKKIFSVVFHGHETTQCSHPQPSSRTKECFRVFEHLSASFFGVMQESMSLDLGLLVAKNGYYIKDFLSTDLAVLTQMDV